MIRTLDGMLGGVMGGVLSIEVGRNGDAFLVERVAYMCFARVERRHPEPRQRGRAVGPPFTPAFGVDGQPGARVGVRDLAFESKENTRFLGPARTMKKTCARLRPS